MLTIKELYEQLVDLTGKIQSTNVADKIVEAAKTGESANVKSVFDTFKQEETELYTAILEFKKNYDEAGSPKIFAECSRNADGENLFVYNSEKVDPYYLYILFFVSEIPDEDVFEEISILTIALRQKGHPKMAEYFFRGAPEYPCYDMLVKIFSKGKKDK